MLWLEAEVQPARTVAAASIPALAAMIVSHRRVLRDLGRVSPTCPPLAGTVHNVKRSWGWVRYRLVNSDAQERPIVLVHGWGRTADSAFWLLMPELNRPVLAVDLPGHGGSDVRGRFTFDLAAEAVVAACEHAGYVRPSIAAHSMGGPVALTAFRKVGRAAFSDFTAIATSAYWIRPRNWIMVAAAPYVMGAGSPILARSQRSDMRKNSDMAGHIAWEYEQRPSRRILTESAIELRKFDARVWKDMKLPPTIWVVTRGDGVIPAQDQRLSARLLGATILEIDAEHSFIHDTPAEAAGLLEGASALRAG